MSTAGRAVLRLAAGGLALAAAVPIWFGFFIGLISLATALQHPDPSVPDGDPCCGYPDTWTEVATGAVYGALCVAGVLGLVYVAWHLARFSLTGRSLGTRQRRRLTFGAALVVVAGLPLLVGGIAEQ